MLLIVPHIFVQCKYMNLIPIIEKFELLGSSGLRNDTMALRLRALCRLVDALCLGMCLYT
jgi:hypothetical protein